MFGKSSKFLILFAIQLQNMPKTSADTMVYKAVLPDLYSTNYERQGAGYVAKIGMYPIQCQGSQGPDLREVTVEGLEFLGKADQVLRRTLEGVVLAELSQPPSLLTSAHAKRVRSGEILAIPFKDGYRFYQITGIEVMDKEPPQAQKAVPLYSTNQDGVEISMRKDWEDCMMQRILQTGSPSCGMAGNRMEPEQASTSTSRTTTRVTTSTSTSTKMTTIESRDGDRRGMQDPMVAPFKPFCLLPQAQFSCQASIQWPSGDSVNMDTMSSFPTPQPTSSTTPGNNMMRNEEDQNKEIKFEDVLTYMKNKPLDELKQLMASLVGVLEMKIPKNFPPVTSSAPQYNKLPAGAGTTAAIPNDYRMRQATMTTSRYPTQLPKIKAEDPRSRFEPEIPRGLHDLQSFKYRPKEAPQDPRNFDNSKQTINTPVRMNAPGNFQQEEFSPGKQSGFPGFGNQEQQQGGQQNTQQGYQEFQGQLRSSILQESQEEKILRDYRARLSALTQSPPTSQPTQPPRRDNMAYLEQLLQRSKVQPRADSDSKRIQVYPPQFNCQQFY